MGIALAVALAVLAGAHLGLVYGIARRGGGGALACARAAVCLLVVPLAPWWGWRAGLRRTTMVWGAALALYTVGVVVAVAVTGR
jgi:hypothetical protein